MTYTTNNYHRCTIYHRKMDATGHLSSKPYHSVIPEFVAYLIKDNALNDARLP